jgi:hypothetical protein
MSRGLSGGALNHLPVNLQTNNMIKINRTSSAVQALYVSPKTGVATVEFNNGTKETFTGVSTVDLEDVLYNSTASLGFFVNQVLLGREPKAAVIAA